MDNYNIIIMLLELVGLLAVVVVPIIRLNTSITALTISVDQLKSMIGKLEERITAHGTEIDELRVEIADHEARLKHLEK